MARRRVFRNVHTGEFVTEETYNRVVAQGGESVKGEYIEVSDEDTAMSVDDLFDFYDEYGDDFDPTEYHGTGDTGRRK
jgi:hypothetical protein